MFDLLPSPTKPSLTATLLALLLFAGCSSSGTGGEEGPEFDSSSLEPGDTYSYTFQEEGTWDYYCRNHEPDMTGSITVSADASTADPDTVSMENLRFVPGNITVAPGTKVVWINREDPSVEPHTVTSGEPSKGGGGGY